MLRGCVIVRVKQMFRLQASRTTQRVCWALKVIYAVALHITDAIFNNLNAFATGFVKGVLPGNVGLSCNINV